MNEILSKGNNITPLMFAQRIALFIDSNKTLSVVEKESNLSVLLRDLERALGLRLP